MKQAFMGRVCSPAFNPSALGYSPVATFGGLRPGTVAELPYINLPTDLGTASSHRTPRESLGPPPCATRGGSAAWRAAGKQPRHIPEAVWTQWSLVSIISRHASSQLAPRGRPASGSLSAHCSWANNEVAGSSTGRALGAKLESAEAWRAHQQAELSTAPA